MSNIFHTLPNIVTVQISDANGTAERFVVGKTLDEVISIIEPEAPVGGRSAKKARKPRRTRAEMSEAEAAPEQSAGEAAMAKLKGGDVPPPHDKPKKDL